MLHDRFPPCDVYRFFFFSSRRRHTRCYREWSSDVCSSDLDPERITYPLRRIGPRGGGRWERVTWDEVLDDIGARIRQALVEGRQKEVMYHLGRPGHELVRSEERRVGKEGRGRMGQERAKGK